MNSAPDLETKQAEDALAARADERLAHAYRQIAEADEQLARLTEHLSKMEHDDTRHAPSVPPPPRRTPSRGGSAMRGLIGSLAAACVIAAALVSQSSYGDAARLVIDRWAPGLASPPWLSPERSTVQAPPRAAAVQVATADTAPSQAMASARTSAPDAAPAPPETTQLLQEMTRVLTNVEQEVEQLKASQERMASDNAKVVEQLRASQEQMTRQIARTSEQGLAPKTSAPLQTSAPLPRPSPTRKPASTHSSPQARAQPQAPVQLVPDDQ